MAVELSVMRQLFEGGALKSVIIAQAPLEEGSWILMVEKLDGRIDYLTPSRSTVHKKYRSLKAATADARRVGFREITLRVA